MKFAIDAKISHWFDAEPLQRAVQFDRDVDSLESIRANGEYDYILCQNPQTGLQLLQKIGSARKPKYLSHDINIEQFIKQNQRSFPASKKTLFSQALGRKTQTIIDATGGWMGDTLLMCSQNYQVTVLERHWMLQGFIAEACKRLSESQWLQSNQAPLPELVKTNAIDFLSSSQCRADCVYIDPMFPPKVKKSAAVRKSMQVLHELVGQDDDAQTLFFAAVESGIKRIVVKRPDYAEPLDVNIERLSATETLQGKLVRYDVYIR